MISALLLAAVTIRTAVAAPPAQTVPVAHHPAPAWPDNVKMNAVAYCDTRQQPTIVLTNIGAADVAVVWTLTAVKPGYPKDVWSSISILSPGKFEGWVSSGSYLQLSARYDDDGEPVTLSVEVACPAASGLVSSLDDVWAHTWNE